MLQAALLDCLFLDLFSFSQNGFVSAEVDVGGCDVVQALVVSLVVVIFDEGPDLALKITGQVVIFQQNSVLHGLMPALDLALGLRVEWRTANVVHLLTLQPFGQIARDVAGTARHWARTNGASIARSLSRRGLCRTTAWSQPDA